MVLSWSEICSAGWAKAGRLKGKREALTTEDMATQCWQNQTSTLHNLKERKSQQDGIWVCCFTGSRQIGLGVSAICQLLLNNEEQVGLAVPPWQGFLPLHTPTRINFWSSKASASNQLPTASHISQLGCAAPLPSHSPPTKLERWQ